MSIKHLERKAILFYDWKRTNTILKDLNITPNQAWLCIMLLEQDYNYKKELFNNYIEKHGGFDYADIEKLEELNYIENCSSSDVPKTVAVKQNIKLGSKSYNKHFEQSRDALILELFIVTPTFKEKVYVDPELAGEEVLNSYPSWAKIKGTRVSLKGIADRQAFYQYYYEIIAGDILKHKFICEMFSKYKKMLAEPNPKVNGMGILKALESRYWDQIQELLELDSLDKDAVHDL